MNKKPIFKGAIPLGTGLFLGALALSGCTPGGGGGTTTPSSGPITNGNSSDTLATVGGQAISRGELTSYLEATHGEELLPQLIDYQLVMQNLKSKGLDVTDAEVNANLDERRGADPRVKAIVDAGGPRLEALKRQIRLPLAMEKLLTLDIKVDEGKLKTWFSQNRKWYDKPASIKYGVLFASTKIRADLMAKQLAAKTRSFKQLVDEQKKIGDPVAGQSIEAAPQPVPLDTLPPAVRGQMAKLPNGGVTTVVPITLQPPNMTFAIFRAVERQPIVKADFTKIRPTVETEYKLAQAAARSVKQDADKPQFLDQAANFIRQSQGQNPTKVRDIVNFFNQNAAQQLVAGLRAAGTVQVSDPNYARVAEQYKAAPAMGLPGTLPGAAPGAPTTSSGAGAPAAPPAAAVPPAAPPAAAPPAAAPPAKP